MLTFYDAINQLSDGMVYATRFVVLFSAVKEVGDDQVLRA